MTLSDAQVERYSRQILLPEVGARGQERLLAACVAVRGTGPAAATAATLLGRAGIGALDVTASLALPELSPDCRVGHDDRRTTPDLLVDLRDPAASTPVDAHPLVLGTLDGTRAVLLTLAGRPCIRCMPPADRPAPGGAAGKPIAALAAGILGTLAATEALRVLLLAPVRGRRTTIDVESGAVDTRELAPATGCPVCGSGA